MIPRRFLSFACALSAWCAFATAVSAQDFTVSVAGSFAFTYPGGTAAATAILARGQTYTFRLGTSVNSPVQHPFWIKTSTCGAGQPACQQPGNSDGALPGVQGNGQTTGDVTFTVPMTGSLYFQCGAHLGMNGAFTLVDARIKTLPAINEYRVDGSAGAYPSITVVRGRTYNIGVNALGHPLWLRQSSAPNGPWSTIAGTTGPTADGVVSWTVPLNASDYFAYQCDVHTFMLGRFNVIDPSLPNGSQCAWAAQCQSGTCTTGICQAALLPNNSACGSSTECLSGFCLEESPRTCQTPNVATGSACVGDSQCATDLCLPNPRVCGARNLANNASCQLDEQCTAGICDGGKCGKAKGKSCDVGTECASRDCENGYCCVSTCNAPSNVCKLAACAPTTGTCGSINNPNTQQTCNDNQSCTVGDHCNGQGACVGTEECRDPIAANCADVSSGACGAGGVCAYTGQGDEGQVCRPAGADLSSQYSCHDGSCVPLDIAGNVFGWGSASNGSGTAIATPTEIVDPITGSALTLIQTASGYEHTIALGADGSVWTWGGNGQGQVGDGTLTPRGLPFKVNLGRLAIAVAAGRYTSYAILDDGSVRAWGDNRRRQLGDSTFSGTHSPSPRGVSSLYDVLAISAGEAHAVILRANGTLAAWGDNTNGQIGNGTTGSTPLHIVTNVANPLTGATRYKAIAAGDRFTAALSVTGQIYVWGSSLDGAAGLPSGNVPRPTLLPNAPVTRAIAAGGSHGLAIDHAGAVWAWGNNTYGTLGNGSVDYIAHYSASRVARLSNASSIAASLYNSAAVLADGSLWTWGANGAGQLGDASRQQPDGYPLDPTPQPIALVNDAMNVSLGAFHANLVKPLNAIKAWGYNANGLLGANLTGNQKLSAMLAVNVELPGDVQTVRAVSASACNSHALLLAGDGTVWSWGDNGQGQLGVTGPGVSKPTRVSQLPPIIAVAAGCYVSAALAGDGTVWTWGYGGLGTLGDGTIVNHTTPARVPSINAMTALSMRGLSVSTLHATGRVYTWGYNGYGEIGVDPSSPRTTPASVALPGDRLARGVAQGYFNGFAILDNGTLAGWGMNNAGQLGNASSATLPSLVGFNPTTPLQNVAMVAPGASATLALGNARRTLFGWGNAYNRQLGYIADGTYNTPQSITTQARTIATGTSLSGMVHSDGSVRLVGSNEYGSLGNNTIEPSASWNPVTGVVNVSAFDVAQYFALAVVPGPARQREYTIEQCAPEVALVAPTSAGPGNSCSVTVGSGDSVRLRGNVLGADRVYRRGEVMIDGTGVITCVGCDCAATPGFADAWTVDCPNAVISPGLINTHEHLTCGVTSPVPDDPMPWPQHDLFVARNDWAQPDISPIHHDCAQNAPEQVAAAEIRHVINGTTSVVGHGRQSAARLLRNLDTVDLALIAQNRPDNREGLRARVVSDTFPLNAGDAPLPPAPSCMGVGRSHMHGADAEIMHLGEGLDARAQRELSCGIGGALNVVHADQSTLVHTMLITPDQAEQLRQRRAWVSWSPRSNIDLYGNTAPVAMLDHSGVGIALGTDWSVTGSVNLGRELACAADYNRTYLDNRFSDYRLWQMVTSNAALAAGVARKVGVLKVGALGDIAIFDQSVGIDHSAVVRSEPRTTAFVMRGGWKVFGDSNVIDALPAAWAEEGVTCNPLAICGQANKQLCGPAISAATPYLAHCPNAPEPSCAPRRPGQYNGVTPTDRDGDGWPDGDDNCPNVFNPSAPDGVDLDDDGTHMELGFQADSDDDGEGDACDRCPTIHGPCPTLDSDDGDADGIANVIDSCPGVPDGTADADNDGIADACDCTFNWCTRDVAETRDAESLRYVPDLDYVLLNDLYVTALVPGAGYFVQADPARLPPISPEHFSNPNHPGNYGNLGIFVATTATPMAHDYNTQTSEPIQVGNRIAVLGQLSGSQAMRTLTVLAAGFHDRGTTLPFPPIDRDAADLASYKVANGNTSGLLAEAFESTWMRVTDVKVAQANPSGGTPLEFSILFRSYNSTNWSPLRVDDHLTNYSSVIGNSPAAGTLLPSVSGVMHVENNLPKLAPRSPSEIVRTP